MVQGNVKKYNNPNLNYFSYKCWKVSDESRVGCDAFMATGRHPGPFLSRRDNVLDFLELILGRKLFFYAISFSNCHRSVKPVKRCSEPITLCIRKS